MVPGDKNKPKKKHFCVFVVTGRVQSDCNRKTVFNTKCKNLCSSPIASDLNLLSPSFFICAEEIIVLTCHKDCLVSFI